MEFEAPLALLHFAGYRAPEGPTSWISKFHLARLITSNVVWFIFGVIMLIKISVSEESFSTSNMVLFSRIVFMIWKLVHNFYIMKFGKERLDNLIKKIEDSPPFDAHDEFVVQEKRTKEISKNSLLKITIGNFLSWTIMAVLFVAPKIADSRYVLKREEICVESHLCKYDNVSYSLTFEAPDSSNQPPFSIARIVRAIFYIQIIWNNIAVDNMIVSLIYVTKTRITLLANTVDLAFAPSPVSPRVTQAYEQWADYRFNVKDIIEEINEFLGGATYMVVTNCVVGTTITGYFFAGTHVIELKFFINAGILLLQTLYFCYVGQGVINEYENMEEKVREVARDQLIKGGYKDGALSDCIQLEVVDGAEHLVPYVEARGIYKLSLVCYAKLLYSCYGYVNTLLELKKSNFSKD